MQIRWHQILVKSYVDGPGARAVLFFQGCDWRCPGCQSPALQDREGGAVTSVKVVVDALLGCNREAVTLSGGDPCSQPEALLHVAAGIKVKAPGCHIVCYTGYTWEALLAIGKVNLDVRTALSYIDVLVDGPYMAVLDDDSLQWRGSSNQRVIDVPLSLRIGSVMTIDWQKPRLIITPEGTTYVAASHAHLNRQAQAQATRRCGQSNV